jgi:hypothetical protein
MKRDLLKELSEDMADLKEKFNRCTYTVTL